MAEQKIVRAICKDLDDDGSMQVIIVKSGWPNRVHVIMEDGPSEDLHTEFATRAFAESRFGVDLSPLFEESREDHSQVPRQ